MSLLEYVDDSGLNKVAYPVTALTDSTGAYSISGLPSGRYDVVADYSGTENYLAHYTPYSALFPDTTFDLAMPIAYLVAGHVDLDTAGHAAGASQVTVTARGNVGGNILATTTTDGTGNYSFGRLVGGAAWNYSIEFDYQGTLDYPHWYYTGPSTIGARDYRLADVIALTQAAPHVDVVVGGGAAIGGTLRSAAGVPLAGEKVEAGSLDASGNFVSYTTSTGPDGYYRLRGLPSQFRYGVHFGGFRDNGLDSAYEFETAPPGNIFQQGTPIDVSDQALHDGYDGVLVPPASLSGNIQLPATAPGQAQAQLLYRETDGSWSAVDTVPLSPSGDYAFAWLPAGQYKVIGGYGPPVAIQVQSPPIDLIAGQDAHFPFQPVDPGSFASLPPYRVLDTRSGLGAPTGPVGPSGIVALQVTGRGGVPSSGVSAVVLNITVASPSAAGFVTAYPDGSTLPTASSLNFVPGQVVPNLVVVPVGHGGKIDLYNGSSGATQLVADVAGYYVDGTPSGPGAFDSVPPSRLLDTRSGVGRSAGAVEPNGVVALQVAGKGGVPPSGVSAVVLNVTVAGASAGGFVTAYADGTSRPTASNLNFVAGQVVPNLVVVPVGSDGKVDLYNGSSGSTQLIADVAGYYRNGPPLDPGAFGSLAPSRLLDTRSESGAVAPGGVVSVQVTGRGSVPASGVSAVVMNVTVAGSSGVGFVTAYADGAPRPTASNLNFVPGQVVPNLVVVPVGDGGKIDLYNGSSGSTQLVADVAGYFLAG